MAIDLAYLLETLREDLGDPLLPGEGSTPDEDSLWSTAELTRYLNEAQDEFCQRINALPDSTGFVSAVTADDPWVKVDERVTMIRKGRLDTLKTDLIPVTLKEIEEGVGANDYGKFTTNSDWEDRVGPPKYVVTDLEAGKGRLVPTPVADDVISWSVYRMPKTSLVDGGCFEIENKFRMGLMLKAKALAYGKHDTETRQESKAQGFESKWEDFIDRSDLDHKRKRRRAQSMPTGGGYW